ncbi:MAG: hypothetical protein L0G34_10395, partial [Staphylococcus equorum]|nr:hypothetical protein [Staphylococcus equorum]
VNWTFEICLYNTNKEFYDNTFANSHMNQGVLQFMLNNKAEAAFRLLENYPSGFIIPEYIKEAIEWVNPIND